MRTTKAPPRSATRTLSIILTLCASAVLAELTASSPLPPSGDAAVLDEGACVGRSTAPIASAKWCRCSKKGKLVRREVRCTPKREHCLWDGSYCQPTKGAAEHSVSAPAQSRTWPPRKGDSPDGKDRPFCPKALARRFDGDEAKLCAKKGMRRACPEMCGMTLERAIAEANPEHGAGSDTGSSAGSSGSDSGSDSGPEAPSLSTGTRTIPVSTLGTGSSPAKDDEDGGEGGDAGAEGEDGGDEGDEGDSGAEAEEGDIDEDSEDGLTAEAEAENKAAVAEGQHVGLAIVEKAQQVSVCTLSGFIIS